VDEIILRCLQNRATREEEDEVSRWRRRSLANEARYRDIVWVWKRTTHDRAPVRRSDPPRFQALLNRGASGGGWSREEDPIRRRGSGVRYAWAAALGALALASTGVLWQNLRSSDARGPVPVSYEIRTGPFESATSTLADGSLVRLAPETSVQIREEEEYRTLEVDCRVLLAVVPDEFGRPFLVRAEGGLVRVLGTRLHVEAVQDRLDVLVLEGSVAVSSAGSEVEVGAGTASHSRVGLAPAIEGNPDVPRILGWMASLVAFDGTPLREAFQELEVRLGLRIVIRDPSIEDRRVTATFLSEDLDEALEVVCRAAGVSCVWDGDEVSVFR
jgi:transmembrane sensor